MVTRLERLVTMQEEIQRGRYPTVQHFCDMFEVQLRTVYEDIRELKERLGQEIFFDRYKNGYYTKNPQKRLPQFDLSEGEVFALTLGKEMLANYTGTSFEPVLRGALEKISQRLPERVQINLDDVSGMVKFNAAAVIPISRKMMLDLYSACGTKTCVDIEYYSASRGETTERRIDPYRLLEHRGTWYLVAFCQLRKGFRLFALHRIRKYEVSAEHFTPCPNAELEKWLGSALFLEHTEMEHCVKIKFLPDAARYIRERQWHPSQSLVEHEDGSCTLSFVASSLDEAKRWVLTYGSDAEVLEPASLRTMMRATLEQALQRYHS